MAHYAGPALRRLKSLAVNLASVADATSFLGLPSRIRVVKVTITNASVTPILAQVAVYDAAAAGGNAIVAAATITALSATTKAIDSTIADADVITTGALYVRCAVANAAALTADVFIDYEELA